MWEDLPIKNPDTERLTAAEWIPLTMKYSRSAVNAFFSLNIAQSTTRIVTKHERIFRVW
jgi:hypothetical protein